MIYCLAKQKLHTGFVLSAIYLKIKIETLNNYIVGGVCTATNTTPLRITNNYNFNNNEDVSIVKRLLKCFEITAFE